MSEQQQDDKQAGKFPTNWHIAADYDPKDHMMNLKGRDYLNVQNRLLWFIRDQRSFISSGLARTSYIIRTELVEMDRDAGFAHFKTFVRDVLGNESTAYGSEALKDFPDYPEKAGTKSLGRALLNLGYGTGFAPEMDEGERVVDAPVERRQQQQTQQRQASRQQQQQQHEDEHEPQEPPATQDTLNAIATACELLGLAVPTNIVSERDALKRLDAYRASWRNLSAEQKAAKKAAPAAAS